MKTWLKSLLARKLGWAKSTRGSPWRDQHKLLPQIETLIFNSISTPNTCVGGGGGGGGSQKSWNRILPFSQGSHPSYDTTWEEAIRRCTIKGYDFFSINIMSILFILIFYFHRYPTAIPSEQQILKQSLLQWLQIQVSIHLGLTNNMDNENTLRPGVCETTGRKRPFSHCIHFCLTSLTLISINLCIRM